MTGFLTALCAYSCTDRRIKRGISTGTANDAQLISIARDMLQTVQEGESNCIQGFIETPEYTFILPDISHYPDDFKAFLNKDLIETSTLVSLEQAGQHKLYFSKLNFRSQLIFYSTLYKLIIINMGFNFLVL